MRYSSYLTEQSRWVLFTPESFKWDFTEYKKKEDKKWKSRAMQIGSRFPIFKDEADFRSSLKGATTKVLSRREASKIGNVALTNSLEDLKSMTSNYVRPRDIDRIVRGLESNDKMPMPIVLKGRNGLFILAGNSRLNVAYNMGTEPKVAIIDVSKPRGG